MNKTTAALKMTEEALDKAESVYEAVRTHPIAIQQVQKALAAIREALAEQEKQEPVAWDLAEKVLRDLDRQSCPCVYMNIAFESIVKNYGAAIRGGMK